MALASAQGTGTTTGPYYPVVNTLISLNDPFIYSQCAQSLQIQNNTTYLLTVQSGGAAYSIQPLTVSTIPSSGGQTITMLPSLMGYVYNQASVVVVWLLPGQTAPMNDGPLSPYVPNGASPTPPSPTPHSLSTSVVSGTNNWQVTSFLATDISATLTYSGAGPNNPYLWLVTTTGIQYGPAAWSSASGTATFSVSGVGASTICNLWSGSATSIAVVVTTSNISSLSGTAHS